MKKFLESANELEILYSTLQSQFKLDTNNFPEEITSKYGQKINIRIDSHWVERITVHIPVYTSRSIKVPQYLNPHPLIEYIARWFLIDSITTKADFRGVPGFISALSRLIINNNENVGTITKLLKKWVTSEIPYAQVSKDYGAATLVSGFIIYGIENDFPGFDETLEYTVRDSFLRQTFKSKVDSLNSFLTGPYNQSEMQEISMHLINSKVLSTKEKALISLCRDFGVRPIQLALLREEDVIRNTFGQYIIFHGAKGIRKSKLRRHPNNVFQRDLNEDTSTIIAELIRENKSKHLAIDTWYRRYCNINNKKYSELPKPLFPREFDLDKMIPFLKDKSLVPYAPHKSSSILSVQIVKTSEKLSIKCADPDGLPLRISAYRFRRTLATVMVIQGYGAQEVAEMLDHESTSSVEHYFRWNRDLISYVNNIYSGSTELLSAVQLWTNGFSDVDQSDFEPKKIVKLTTIDSLGICANKDPCNLHPTVSCYGCPNFSPFRDGAHKKALDNIRNISNEISSQSSGPIRSQLNAALETAIRIVEAQSALT